MPGAGRVDGFDGLVVPGAGRVEGFDGFVVPVAGRVAGRVEPGAVPGAGRVPGRTAGCGAGRTTAGFTPGRAMPGRLYTLTFVMLMPGGRPYGVGRG